MLPVKYEIYELSARAVISFAEEANGTYSFCLSRNATHRCFTSKATTEQEDNALFYQMMCELHGDGFQMPIGEHVISDLSKIIFYMDFSGVFDRSCENKKYDLRQKKAEAMFRAEGVVLDFGDGSHRFLAFERSASMSRHAKLSFIREDFYEAVRQRIMMDIHIGECQLSKLYAYNGLMLSSGTRVDGIGIDRPHRVIVIDNEKHLAPKVPVITVVDDGTQNSTRKYRCEQRTADVEVLCFDGEGLISKDYAKTVDRAYCGEVKHTSFQIRLPFVKGMLHQVDFHDFLRNAEAKTITDIWGDVHAVDDVDIILTKSMFKGYGWLNADGKSWADYWDAFRRYRHALYITGVSKTKPEKTTVLNYQFLNTLTLDEWEFRPADELPSNWTRNPSEFDYPWLTKQTELSYYNFCANADFRLNHFMKALESNNEQEWLLASLLMKNPLLIGEPVFTKEFDTKAEKILEEYSIGHLIVDGDNRFLSADLMDFLLSLVNREEIKTEKARRFYLQAQMSVLRDTECYAPGSIYEIDDTCVLLRNPHISKNEEVVLSPAPEGDELREHYLGALTDVVMVSTQGLCAERLGGADFDGDMVKTITDPVICSCVNRNSSRVSFNGKTLYEYSPPLLHIPTVEPLIRDAGDWHARFETVSRNFSSRVGQICNAALDRSVIAYNENSSSNLRTRCLEETKALAILTGLEIDSAKSGVRPDLSDYLGQKQIPRSPFLRYKALFKEDEYGKIRSDPSKKQKIKAFFEKYDWSTMDSNLERLPYMANSLKENTPRMKSKPAAESDLFVFAKDEHWKEQLNADILNAVGSLLNDYEACLSRIRACRAPIKEKRRESDIDRILFSRGQENDVDTDELYAYFKTMEPERISSLRKVIVEEKWCFMSSEERESFLVEWLPELVDIYDLLSDFRCSGFIQVLLCVER